MDTDGMIPIQDYEDYLISEIGEVYNQRTESFMAISRTMQGDRKVTLSQEGCRTTRSIRVLVAEAFVYNPNPHETYEAPAFDTVVLLDGDKENIHPSNLTWRPKWFAQCYVLQMKRDYDEFVLSRPVLNAKTGQIHDSILACSVSEGVLIDDVIRSIRVGDTVFPHFAFYLWDVV